MSSWQQLLSAFLVPFLILATTPVNVEAQTYTPVFYYYHSDHLGSSNVMTDRSGTQVQRYEYGAWGTETYKNNTSAFSVSNRYTGQILDEETGLYYYNARYYDPELGRFTQADTIVPSASDPQTLNRYAYCGNNPLKYVDPSGHDFGISAIIVGVVIGAAIGGATAAATGGNIGMGVLTGAIGGLFGGLGAGLGQVIGTAINLPTLGAFTGAVLGGASGGAAIAAVVGGDVAMGALTGAIAGGIGFGVGRLNYELIGNYVEDFNELLIGATVKGSGDALSGGIGSVLQGGDFAEGSLGGVAGFAGFAGTNFTDAWKATIGRSSQPTRVVGDTAAYQQARNSHKDIDEMARVLEKRGGYTVNTNNQHNNSFVRGTKTVNWDPTSALRVTTGGTMTPAVILAHEFKHALSPLPGFVRGIPAGRYTNVEEWRVIALWEANFARGLGQGVRFDHYGTPYRVAGPTAR